MGKRIEYERLQTIEDVRKERIRVKRDIRLNNRLLEEDADRVGELFSVEYWGNIVSVKLAAVVERVTSGFASRIRGFSSGFNLLSNLASNLFGRFSRQPRYAPRRSVPYYSPRPDYEPWEEEEDDYDLTIRRDQDLCQ